MYCDTKNTLALITKKSRYNRENDGTYYTPLNRIPYANCVVFHKDDLFTYGLISYNTTICYIEKGVLYLSDRFYSNTTIKHISAFLKEYNLIDYYSYKDLVKQGVYKYDLIDKKILAYHSNRV